VKDKAKERLRVLYIMGTARSGTTILDILLGSARGIESRGEVTHCLRDAILKNQRCACGLASLDCDVWGSLRQICETRSRAKEIISIIRGIERHSRFPMLYLNMIRGHCLEIYREVNHEIYRHISPMPATTIIDSSKYPGRALALSRSFPGQILVLCVTRSAAGVISSFRKQHISEQKPKSLLAAMLYYLYTLSCMRLALLRLDPKMYCIIRYEQLVSNPVGTLRRIESWSRIDLSDVIRRIEVNRAFEIGHILTGNRVRYAGTTNLISPEKVPENPLAGAAAIISRILERYRGFLRF